MTVRGLNVLRIGLLSSALYIPTSFFYAIFGLPYSWLVVALDVIPLSLLGLRILETRSFIDVQLGNIIEDIDKLSICSRSFPVYRLADVFYAARYIVREMGEVADIKSRHRFNLDTVLSGNTYYDEDRKVSPPRLIARDIDVDRKDYFPSDQFWVVKDGAHKLIVRVSIDEYENKVNLEVAARDPSRCAALVESIVDRSTKHSVFKNRILELQFEAEVRDADGDIEQQSKVDLVFKRVNRVQDDDIVLDNDVRRVIERNVIDFHKRRADLMSVGLAGTKGVLLYGPPGTGKTHTCRYMTSRLKDTTTIVATGQALLHIKSICNIARMLQPTMVVLEDVDLVFTDRDVTPYSAVLGELMDQLDGFSPSDQITFVLTTNSIDRIESAIKDRPGRVSQCIYVGPPSAELRKRYFENLLKRYVVDNLDFDRLVKKSDGASQAFIKELVNRAVQIATEERENDLTKVRLLVADFDTAMSEMTNAGGNANRSIIGFRTH